MVYVLVADATIIPEDRSTFGPFAVAHLRDILQPEEWYGSWTTLTVNRDRVTGAIGCQMDAFPPPAVPAALLVDTYPKYDLLTLQTVHAFNGRVREVELPGVALKTGPAPTCILKTANQTHEVRWVATEIKAYQYLNHVGGNCLVPKLLAYVYEVSPDRVVGFLVERIEGRPAGIEDLPAAKAALQGLHQYLFHGDTCRYNILVTDAGLRFIDLENSILRADWEAEGGIGELEEKMEQELESSEADLRDESARGRPRLPSVA